MTQFIENPKDPLNLINSILNDSYLITDYIGAGGMCYVYKGKQELLNKVVAIKILQPHLVSNQTVFRRFQHEGKLAASLAHINIINIYNLNVSENGLPYLVLDFIEGKSLSEILKEENYLELTRALNIFKQIASALSAAHEKNIIHRDLKPSNIMILNQDDGSEIVKLTDFGIAKILSHQDEDSLKLTKTGEVFGSPMYMSPEQCRGENLDNRSDIYSFGCLMYETITGRTPYQASNLVESLYAHLNEFPQRIEIANPKIKIPDKLEALIMKCLAKDPNLRYGDAKQIYQDLNEIKDNTNLFYNFFNKIVNEFKIFYFRTLKLSRRENLLLLLLGFVLISFLGIYSFTNNEANKLIANLTLNWQFDLNKYFPNSSINQAQANKSSLKGELNLLNSMLAPSNIHNESKFNPDIGGYNPITAYQELFSSGERTLKDGNYALAANVFKEATELAIKIHGKNAYPTLQCELHYAYCLDQQNKFNDARTEYKNLIECIKKIMLGRRQKLFLNESLLKLAQMDGREGTILIREIKKNPDPQYLTTIAECFKEAGQIYSGGLNNQNSTDSNNFNEIEGICYALSADYYYLLNDYKQSIANYILANHAWENVVFENSAYNEALCNFKLANAYFNSGDLDNANSTLKVVLDDINKLKEDDNVYNLRLNCISLDIKILEKQNRWLECNLKKLQLLQAKHK